MTLTHLHKSKPTSSVLHQLSYFMPLQHCPTLSKTYSQQEATQQQLHNYIFIPQRKFYRNSINDVENRKKMARKKSD